MKHGIMLTPEQGDELDSLRLRTPSADVFRNCWVSRVNGRKNRMGIIFDHDDVNRKAA